MTRKDYILIAAALRETLAHIACNGDSERLSDTGRTHLGGERAGVRHAALRVMEALASDNPRFERETFLKACGIAA
jgi:hypothetical protein